MESMESISSPVPERIPPDYFFYITFSEHAREEYRNLCKFNLTQLKTLVPPTLAGLLEQRVQQYENEVVSIRQIMTTFFDSRLPLDEGLVQAYKEYKQSDHLGKARCAAYVRYLAQQQQRRYRLAIQNNRPDMKDDMPSLVEEQKLIREHSNQINKKRAYPFKSEDSPQKSKRPLRYDDTMDVQLAEGVDMSTFSLVYKKLDPSHQAFTTTKQIRDKVKNWNLNDRRNFYENLYELVKQTHSELTTHYKEVNKDLWGFVKGKNAGSQFYNDPTMILLAIFYEYRAVGPLKKATFVLDAQLISFILLLIVRVKKLQVLVLFNDLKAGAIKVLNEIFSMMVKQASNAVKKISLSYSFFEKAVLVGDVPLIIKMCNYYVLQYSYDSKLVCIDEEISSDDSFSEADPNAQSLSLASSVQKGMFSPIGSPEDRQEQHSQAESKKQESLAQVSRNLGSRFGQMQGIKSQNSDLDSQGSQQRRGRPKTDEEGTLITFTSFKQTRKLDQKLGITPYEIFLKLKAHWSKNYEISDQDVEYIVTHMRSMTHEFFQVSQKLSSLILVYHVLERVYFQYQKKHEQPFTTDEILNIDMKISHYNHKNKLRALLIAIKEPNLTKSAWNALFEEVLPHVNTNDVPQAVENFLKASNQDEAISELQGKHAVELMKAHFEDPDAERHLKALINKEIQAEHVQNQEQLHTYQVAKEFSERHKTKYFFNMNQVVISSEMWRNKKSYLTLPTGQGKTFIAAHLVGKYFEVHPNDSGCIAFITLDQVLVNQFIEVVQDMVSPRLAKRVAYYSSIQQMVGNIRYKSINAVIIDECDVVLLQSTAYKDFSNTFVSYEESLAQMQYLFFMTANDNDKFHKLAQSQWDVNHLLQRKTLRMEAFRESLFSVALLTYQSQEDKIDGIIAMTDQKYMVEQMPLIIYVENKKILEDLQQRVFTWTGTECVVLRKQVNSINTIKEQVARLKHCSQEIVLMTKDDFIRGIDIKFQNGAAAYVIVAYDVSSYAEITQLFGRSNRVGGKNFGCYMTMQMHLIAEDDEWLEQLKASEGEAIAYFSSTLVDLSTLPKEAWTTPKGQHYLTALTTRTLTQLDDVEKPLFTKPNNKGKSSKISFQQLLQVVQDAWKAQCDKEAIANSQNSSQQQQNVEPKQAPGSQDSYESQ